MGKIDDMRKLREAQHAARSGTPDAKAKSKVTAATKSSDASDAGDEEFGECSECGKRKALSSGLVVNHQKGFGKMCPGARKKPA